MAIARLPLFQISSLDQVTLGSKQTEETLRLIIKSYVLFHLVEVEVEEQRQIQRPTQTEETEAALLQEALQDLLPQSQVALEGLLQELQRLTERLLPRKSTGLEPVEVEATTAQGKTAATVAMVAGLVALAVAVVLLTKVSPAAQVVTVPTATQ